MIAVAGGWWLVLAILFLSNRGDDVGRLPALTASFIASLAHGPVWGPPGFLAAVADLARDHDVLFVLDEVQGLRNGFGGEQGRLGLTPDLKNATSVSDPIVTLRVVGGSQNQSLDCEPPGYQPSDPPLM